MLGALLYLRAMSLGNWLRSRLRRLRQPKYLIGAAVTAAYVYFFFFRAWSRGPRGSLPAATPEALRAMDAARAALPVEWQPITTALGAMALLVFITFMWLIPAQRAALGFSEAEIAFLFPAPISRRALVHFRLLSSQFRSLFGATVMMLLSNRWSILGGNALTHAVGWWLIFSALNLHFSGANFTLTRLADHGLSPWRRRLGVAVLVGAVVAATIWRLPPTAALPAIGTSVDLRAAIDWFVALGNTAPLGWLLMPFKLVLGPFLALDASRFFIALPAALGVLTVHYLWVVRTAVAFEDSSIAYAQKRTARVEAWRSGRRRPGATATKARPGPFRLASVGRPEWAFLWKNLLSTWPYFTVRVLLGCALVLTLAVLWLRSHPLWHGVVPAVGGLALMFGAYTLIVGPQFARQDIRSDLANADILKTYPLAGWQVVLGELLTPIAILTGFLWLALLVAALAFQPSPSQAVWLTPGVRLTTVLGVALITPALVSLQLLVPNAAALFFPAWFQTVGVRGGGPEVIGQRMIFFFAQLLTMVAALLPPGILAAVGVFVLHRVLGVALAPVIAIAAAGVVLTLLGEAWCGLWWLGERFERLDLSADLRS